MSGWRRVHWPGNKVLTGVPGTAETSGEGRAGDPKGLRRQPLDLTAAGKGHTGSVTPSGSLAPVMKATASDIE